jgi:hypothetical protein
MAGGVTTYHDLEVLRNKLAKVIADFKRDFPETEIALSINTETLTVHGPERMRIVLKEIPAHVPQLPGFGDDDRAAVERPFG